MSSYVNKNHKIPEDTRTLISKRYKAITKAINKEFWNSESDSSHSRYVGSYGRGTATDTSDLDVLIELPNDEYEHFTSMNGNGPSRLLQAVKDSILESYPRTDISADGQVVVVKFSDGMKFEVLPAFQDLNYWGEWKGTYIYPDTHMGGNWMTTNPIAEQDAMKQKNAENESNGLLFDTCKHIRYVHTNYYSSYHLSGILIDSFVYAAIKGWHWHREGDPSNSQGEGSYEKSLLDYYNLFVYSEICPPRIQAPGSNMILDTSDWETLGKVLKKMVG